MLHRFPQKKAAVPPHLHLSAALISKTFPQEKLDWNTINPSKKVFFIDPLTLIDCDYGIINAPVTDAQ